MERKIRVFIILSILIFILGVTVSLLSYIAPPAIGLIDYLLTYELSHSDSLYAFSFLIVLTFLLVLAIFVLLVRNRKFLLPPHEKVIYKEKVFGNYSSERRYIEKQIDELTTRLMNTEEKWEKLHHLLLSANSVNVKNIVKNNDKSSESFLSGLGIDLDSISIDKRMIFVLTPSDKEYLSDYLAVYNACHSCHLNTVRGDNEDLKYGNRNMLTFIIEHILSARIVIANISNRNPNVFYELGIAHMAGKSTILLCRTNEQVPFDLQQKYVVFYSSTAELEEKLKDELISIIAEENN